MPRDDVFVNKVFNLLLFSDVSYMTDGELKKYIGHNYAKYDKLRVQLAAHVIKVNREGDKDATAEGDDAKNERVPEGLQFMDCDVHAGSYEPLKIEAQGEKDWHQHSTWACFFASLSAAFEDARGTLREVYNEIYAWEHRDDCASLRFNIDMDTEDTTTCTCGVGKLQDKILTTLKRIGAA